MTQNRPPQAASAKDPGLTAVMDTLSKARFNTTDILKALYRSNLAKGLKDANLIQSLDQVLKDKRYLASGIATDDEVAKSHLTLHDTPNRLSEVSGELLLVLDELKREKHSSHSKFEMEYFAIKGRIEPINEEREALKRQYHELMRQRHSITSWLNEYIQGNKSVSDITRELEKLQSEERVFVKKVNEYANKFHSLQNQLDELHAQAWKSAKERNHLKQPYKVEAISAPRYNG
jgi:chromosome segregation ATPase